MSNDVPQPRYNLRRKRLDASKSASPSPKPAGPPAAYFVAVSELIRREEELAGLDQGQQGKEIKREELVSDLPPVDDDEGGGTNKVASPQWTVANGDQRIIDSSGEAQGPTTSLAHCNMVGETIEHHGPEILRLRVQVRDKRSHTLRYRYIYKVLK